MSRICTISKQKTCLGDRLGHRRSHFPCHRESLTSPSLTTSSWCSHVAWVQSNGAVLDMAPDPPPLHWNSSVAADLQAEQEPELTSYQTAVLWKSQFPNPVSRSIADPTQCIWGWGSWALITPVLHWLLASSISEAYGQLQPTFPGRSRHPAVPWRAPSRPLTISVQVPRKCTGSQSRAQKLLL